MPKRRGMLEIWYATMQKGWKGGLLCKTAESFVQ